MNVKDGEIKALLTQYKKFCVYGLSPDAEKAGLRVVSNRCLIPEHKRWFLR